MDKVDIGNYEGCSFITDRRVGVVHVLKGKLILDHEKCNIVVTVSHCLTDNKTLWIAGYGVNNVGSYVSIVSKMDLIAKSMTYTSFIEINSAKPTISIEGSDDYIDIHIYGKKKRFIATDASLDEHIFWQRISYLVFIVGVILLTVYS